MEMHACSEGFVCVATCEIFMEMTKLMMMKNETEIVASVDISTFNLYSTLNEEIDNP